MEKEVGIQEATVPSLSIQNRKSGQGRASPLLEDFLVRRPRRNRKSGAIRSLVQETWLSPRDFVAPLFLLEGVQQRETIESLPGVFRFSLDHAVKEVEELYELGVRAIDLFTVVPKEKKDARGTEAIRSGNLLQRAVSEIKKTVPDMCVMVDIALDPFTDHGHDGIVNEEGHIVNDATLKVLSEMSAMVADAGVDVVAPSDMMDGRVAYIRRVLDQKGHQDVSILSYTAKYASALYGPFREALHSAPKFGDKKGYQMNPGNVREALMEAALDEEEGADMLLVKPALPYLDVIAKLREKTTLPLGAYHVSGEYAMVMAAAQNGWIDGDKAMMECLLSIKRAGADFVLSYAAKHVARLLQAG